MKSSTGGLEVLFQPVQIGSMMVKNRVVMPPMGTNFATPDGLVTQRHLDYYGARAKGGAGLVIVEVACVDFPVGKAVARQLAIHDDRCIPGLSQLAQAIQKHGARAAIQIHHAGREARKKNTGLQPVAPSPIPSYPGADMPRELTVSEIAEIVRHYGEAAERAKKAGFDAVELHGASGYLVVQFLSASSNRRRDGYGGDIESRARFLLEVISAIRQRVGRDYPMWSRLNVAEFGIENGITPEEARITARMAEQAGVDAVHISAWGGPGETETPFKPTPLHLLPFAEGMKKAVNVPVIAVGKIDPERGDAIIRQGKADLIAIGRAFIADPDVGIKAASGRMDDVVPCIACLKCVEEVVFKGNPLVCTVNPAVGNEPQHEIKPAARPKKVLVVGGGPAGLEAARVAALRGHIVTLYEKANELGGQLVSAVIPPRKDRLQVLLDYLRNQVKKTGVKVVVGQAVTSAVVDNLRPDTAVLASGVEPLVPDIPGLDAKKAAMAEDVLRGRAKVGDRVVIIGGELVGCETADFLSEQGKKVTVTRRGDRMASGMMPLLRYQLLARLSAKGVTLLTGVKYEKVTDKGLIITDKDGQQRTIEADTIVLAAGSQPNTELLEMLRAKIPEVHLAGDCVQPRSLAEAIAEGNRVGREL